MESIKMGLTIDKSIDGSPFERANAEVFLGERGGVADENC